MTNSRVNRIGELPRVRISIQDILRAARGAYEREELQAQKIKIAENPSKVKCLYAGPCAIGASIDPDIAAQWDAESPAVGSLFSAFVLKVYDERGKTEWTGNIQPDLKHFQVIHDNWVGAAADARGNDAELRHDHFVKELEKLEQRYL